MNGDQLRALFDSHPELYKLFLNDATVHAWFQQFHNNNCSLEEAFVGIVVHLAKEKQTYFDQVAQYSNMYGHIKP